MIIGFSALNEKLEFCSMLNNIISINIDIAITVNSAVSVWLAAALNSYLLLNVITDSKIKVEDAFYILQKYY